MKLCEKCNKINTDKAEKCRYCGEPFESEIPYGFKIINDLDNSDSEVIIKEPPREIQEKKAIPVSKENIAVNNVNPPREANVNLTPIKSQPSTFREIKIEENKPVSPINKKNTRKIEIKKEDRVIDVPSLHSRVTIRPDFNKTSIKYKEKIAAYSGLEKMKCPKCGSDNLSFVANTEKRGFNGSDACCGYMILGPIGLLCGSFGANKVNTVEYWICGNCGNKFQTNAGNSEKEKIKRDSKLISDTADEIVDNIDRLYSASCDEMNNIKKNHKAILKKEYSENKPLKMYALISAIAAFLLLVLTVIFLVAFNDNVIPAIITGIIGIVLIGVAILIKPKMEDKYASKIYKQSAADCKESAEINQKLKRIKEAKEHLISTNII